MEHCSCSPETPQSSITTTGGGTTRGQRGNACSHGKVTRLGLDKDHTCAQQLVSQNLFWWSFSSSHWCSWRPSWRNQGCKVSVMSGWVTPFLCRFFPCCRLHKRLVISIIRDNGMIPLRKASIIFVFMHVLCVGWICWGFRSDIAKVTCLPG